MMGMANAAVFPVPVCAQPNISFPTNSAGIAFACIGVGLTYHFSSIAINIDTVIYKSLNVINVVFEYAKNISMSII